MRYRELIESVDVHPAELKVIDGEKYINFPENGVIKTSIPCPYCDEEGNSKYAAEYGVKEPCDDCFGTRIQDNTEYKFPNLNVSNNNMKIVCDILQAPEDDHLWIPPERVDFYIKHLLKLKNSDTSRYTSTPSVDKGVIVDKSNEIPQIKPRITVYNSGLSQDQIDRYVNKLLEIFIWAKKNGCGVSAA